MRRGDVVLIAWPFTDLSAAKVRPAVVVSSNDFNRGEDRVLVAISSRVDVPGRWEVLAAPTDSAFRATGLRRASAIQCGKILTANRAVIKRRLGVAGPYLPQIESRIKDALSIR